MSSKRKKEDCRESYRKEKRAKTVICPQYFGYIRNDARDGIHRITFRYNDKSIVIAAKFNNGVIDGRVYAYDETTGRALYMINIEGNNKTEECDLSKQECYRGIIDQFSGERWEGDIYQNFECGNGCEFNTEGDLIYKGLKIMGLSEGMGTEYYTDWHEESPLYVGTWCYGKRHGEGILYDRNGNLDYEGWFAEGKVTDLPKNVVITNDDIFCLSIVESITIASGAYNSNNTLSFTRYFCLKSIIIEDNACQNVCDFTVKGLRYLESIHVGEKSCSNMVCTWMMLRINRDSAQEHKKEFRVENCPSLQSIKLGKQSFVDYTKCIIEQCPSLQTIEIGEANDQEDEHSLSYNFFYTSDFQLHNLPKLSRIVFGNSSFFHSTHVAFHHLKSLQSLTCGVYSFYGDDREKEGYNHVEFIHLPLFSSIYAYKKSFYNYIELSADELPSLLIKKNIHLCNSSFNYTNKIRRGNNVSNVFLTLLQSTFVKQQIGKYHPLLL